MKKVVVIMVGVSGSGKSTWIEEFLRTHPSESSVIASADHFFMQNGLYNFNASKLGAAHDYCKEKFSRAIQDGVDTIFVDNTNTRKWERGFYITEAKKNGYKVFLKVLRVDPEVAANRNRHGVPLNSILNMDGRIDVPEGFYEV